MSEFIKEVRGDLLAYDAKVRCHQVNCKGVMGAGLAKQVKEKYPEAYEQYKAMCDQFGSSLLGHPQFVICHDGTVMANLFAQDGHGTDAVQTVMGALDDCLSQVANFCFRIDAKPAFPKLMGCGLAGGNWDDVSKLIAQYFDFKSAGCTIVEYAPNELLLLRSRRWLRRRPNLSPRLMSRALRLASRPLRLSRSRPRSPVRRGSPRRNSSPTTWWTTRSPSWLRSLSTRMVPAGSIRARAAGRRSCWLRPRRVWPRSASLVARRNPPTKRWS